MGNKLEKHHHLRITLVRAGWLLITLALLACSVLSFLADGHDLSPISVYLGAAMLFAGLMNLLIYEKNKHRIHGAHWLLADGMSTALLSLFLLFNDMTTPAMIPFFFGMWELFSGVLKVNDAWDLKDLDIFGWHWFLGTGIFELVSGVIALIKPIDDLIGANVVVAVILFVQCCSYIFKILIFPRIQKHE
ncbi:MAG: DUF308 domain-containing protein [Clostridiales bacterium]|nr:DUF308 domain-containing protein [Clostridiales bacterium]